MERYGQYRSARRTGAAPHGPPGGPNGVERGGARSLQNRLGITDGVYAGQVELRIPAGLPFDSWCRLGSQIKRVSESSVWWLADWLVFGEEEYPDRYQVVIKRTSLSYQTLRNYAWVARKFPVARRRDALSLQHHAETAALPADEQDRWLERAERERWSARRLRRELRGHHAVDGGAAARVQVTLNLDSERRGRWTQAAEAAHVPLMEWIVRTVDDAAAP
ncbi:LmbU family transcriptional regulator [Streptomyces clavuligerus]|uniref:LmbU and cloE-like protein n=2 Tax=Streptomyces clavuligerus TaxID=1901 RepID=E2Q2J3_STRCL|nr:LmbU family transcriptional regulator [Streptomyces clavuligerus]ANW16788.1 LmbU and cloE [Streptomyces clavuligerus]AXU11317.1 LmbU and cloE [Streptomyces clavuligerus]EFG10704.1 LmbU and cloE-like protein [Streptomyces clavuligerus]MBY6301124.1 LmbU family transcriptional regulator [Streptomyces clavuligerus]QCS04185.1 LmbU and cloE [Streptomyces clavuligerus]